MDTLRGSAILLLLLWHASSIPRQFGFTLPGWLFLLNEIFLPWRMPTLMFLSGVLLAGSLKKPTREYYIGKARNILWPYLLWAAAFLAFYPEPGGALSNPVSWFGAGYLWFLCYLFIYYAVAPLVVRFPGWIVLPTLAIAALLMPWTSPQKVLFFAVFYFGGHYLKGAIAWATNAPRLWLWLGLGISVGFTIVSLILSAQHLTHFFQFAIVAVPFVFVQILTSARIVHDLDARWSATGVVRFVSWVGRNSIVFYLSHWPAILGACALSSLLTDDPGLWIVAVCFAAALATGCLLARFNTTPALSWLFRAPRFASPARPAATAGSPV
ncbi:hypothetical protein Microterr_01930 [Microbacterium terricola]|uniref:Acyltransferase 3 domain-containing protein n=2 Tax=Microbacterium terricola TaxID=344163 RepID=A0ABM8DV70_9MICO|nr:hypothetical protein Microterr_01930 [Microbacterium terricola]